MIPVASGQALFMILRSVRPGKSRFGKHSILKMSRSCLTFTTRLAIDYMTCFFFCFFTLGSHGAKVQLLTLFRLHKDSTGCAPKERTCTYFERMLSFNE